MYLESLSLRHLIDGLIVEAADAVLLMFIRRSCKPGQPNVAVPASDEPHHIEQLSPKGARGGKWGN